MVAAVFSYVMLRAGFFSAHNSQELVHSGVQQASSSLALSGDVYARSEAQNGVRSFFSFYVKDTAGGTPIDLNKTIITYTDKDDFATIGISYLSPTNNNAYYIPVISNGSAENLVEEGEIYRIDLVLPGPPLNLSSLPGENEVVKLEVKSPDGAALTIQRKMPPSITAITTYPVY
jgi:flagellin FlaB